MYRLKDFFTVYYLFSLHNNYYFQHQFRAKISHKKGQKYPLLKRELSFV